MKSISARLGLLVMLCLIAIATQRLLADDKEDAPLVDPVPLTDAEDDLKPTPQYQPESDERDDDFEEGDSKEGRRRARLRRHREHREHAGRRDDDIRDPRRATDRRGPPRSHGEPLGRRQGGPGHPHPFRAHVQLDPEMKELFQRDHELERRTRELAAQMKRASAASGPESDEPRQEIKNVVEEHFQVRQERREHELNHLRERLEQLERSIERRNEAREEIISRRVAELTGTQHDLSF